MAGIGHQQRNQLSIVSRTWAFGFMSKVILFWKTFKQSVKVVDDYPEAESFVVLFEVFFESFVEILISSFRTFERAPIVTKDLTVSDESTIPLWFLNLHVIFHRIDVALQMNRLEVWSTGDGLNFFVLFPPSLQGKNFNFCWVNIYSKHFLLASIALFTRWATDDLRILAE